MRQGFSAWYTSTTTPSRSRNTASMAIFMKNVWIEVHGTMCRPLPIGKPVTPMSPLNRVMNESAASASSANSVFRVVFVT